MFLCKDCTLSSVHWMFDLAMALSYGCCEACEEVKPCVDVNSDFIKPIEDRKKDQEKGSKIDLS